MSKLADQLDAKSDDVDHVVSDPSHESEELPRQFSLFSTLAFGFSMTNSWLGYSATFITPLLLGGSPTVFFGLIAASIASCFITAGLAELASAYPSSGGQYHFAYMVSSPRYRTLVAFVMGWLSVVAWALTSASTALVCAQMIGSLAGMYNPSYIGEAWQTWMIYVLLVLIATSIVCLLPSSLPRGEMVMFVSSFLGFVASFIVVLATQKRTQSAKAVFVDFNNTSGWSDGTSFVIGLGTCMYAYLAIDGACHIAEELPNPRSDVPRAMGLTMLIGMMTVIPWTVVFLFSITDIDAVASSSIPVYTIYLQATQSQSAATVLTVWILFVYFGALVSCIVTTGRLAYAFSRDGGLPCSGFFARIHHKHHAPVNATVGTANLFTIKDNITHAAHKKALSGCFSKSSIMSSQTARAASRDVLFNRVLPLVYKASTENKAIEVIELSYSCLLDTFVQWQFGRSLGSNLVEDEQERRMYLDGFLGISGYTFWQYHFPTLISILQKIGIHLIPKSVLSAFESVESWNLEKCDQAQQLLASGKQLSSDDQPVAFEPALKGMSEVDAKPKSYPQRLPLASDMFSLNSGAFETSGNTSTYLFWELSRRPEWQTKLREELLGLNPPLKHVPGKRVEIEDLTSPQDIDKLPILHAVLMETLRLWPSVPGGQPRIVPRPCTLGGYHNIPAGTTVQSYASVLHRTPDVFPDPFEWKPERWLDASQEELALMRKWFWGFGSGGRMCLGLHFAYYSMKFLFAGIYSNFTTTIHDHGDMEPSDGYLAGPIGHRLELKFHLVE
ncbi:hypothetical protein PENCOP_c002G07222 [Penicillium coprophilum]|uniref:Amino acid permease/ SLC12A domain-containing protein n=1 Tax=Penicillium coprophilum TaxID=36646 RepID=A0A1V6V1M3_9EURO|nr:hypothetical protein PENCOP_c002G07222 [Penicillium coprophilum]